MFPFNSGFLASFSSLHVTKICFLLSVTDEGNSIPRGVIPVIVYFYFNRVKFIFYFKFLLSSYNNSFYWFIHLFFSFATYLSYGKVIIFLSLILGSFLLIFINLKSKLFYFLQCLYLL